MRHLSRTQRGDFCHAGGDREGLGRNGGPLLTFEGSCSCTLVATGPLCALPTSNGEALASLRGLVCWTFSRTALVTPPAGGPSYVSGTRAASWSFRHMRAPHLPSYSLPRDLVVGNDSLNGQVWTSMEGRKGDGTGREGRGRNEAHSFLATGNQEVQEGRGAVKKALATDCPLMLRGV